MSNKIQGSTSLFGVLGYPIKHSKSPLIQNTAFESLGLDCVYVAFDVPGQFTKEAVDAMRILNVKGFNVTMPHKIKILDYLDGLSDEARFIGSVNTVINENNKLIGYNTDGRGFVKALEEHSADFKGKKVVIAGAGGAARSIAIQLAFDGAGEIVIVNRKDAFFRNAEEIADIINKNIPACKCKAREMSESVIKEEAEDSAVLANCTSMGMKPDMDQSIVTSRYTLHKDLFVADIVYDPVETMFLKVAEEAGCRTMNGLDLLVWQGAIAFNIWTGHDMPVDIIKKEIFAVHPS